LTRSALGEKRQEWNLAMAVRKVQTLIRYSSSNRAYLDWSAKGKPEMRPGDCPFWFPEETEKNDRYLMYVGGIDKAYVGWGIVLSDWKKGSGLWKGHYYVTSDEHYFREPIPALDVLAATGFKPPRGAKVIDNEIAAEVWRAVRGTKLSPTDRAVEGILTESRSRSRNAGLRLAALQRANGMCEGCGTNFAKKHGGLGRRCLVVHHKKQIKDTDQLRETKLSELAVVCANCHMMIHVNSEKALTLAQLKKRIGVTK
jgi:hypothetical protein